MTGYPIVEIAPDVTLVPGLVPIVELGRGTVRPRMYAIPFRGGIFAVRLRMQAR
jgi:hypothetical protein